jgi:hypothetical protein
MLRLSFDVREDSGFAKQPSPGRRSDDADGRSATPSGKPRGNVVPQVEKEVSDMGGVSRTETRISVYDGKYTFVREEGDYRVEILRHGEPWVIIEKGSNAINQLLEEFIELRERVAALAPAASPLADERAAPPPLPAEEPAIPERFIVRPRECPEGCSCDGKSICEPTPKLSPEPRRQLTDRECTAILGSLISGLAGSMAAPEVVRRAVRWWAETEAAWKALEYMAGQAELVLQEAVRVATDKEPPS